MLGTQAAATQVQRHLSRDTLILNELNRLKTSLAAAIESSGVLAVIH